VKCPGKFIVKNRDKNINFIKEEELIEIFKGGDLKIVYRGIPKGYQEHAMMEFLNQLVKGTINLSEEELRLSKGFNGNVKLFVSNTCTKCPIIALYLYQIIIYSKGYLEVVSIEDNPLVVEQYNIKAVPRILIGQKLEIPPFHNRLLLINILRRSQKSLENS